MFFDIFQQLCDEKGKKPCTVAREIGFNNSLITHWRKKGFAPKDDLKQQIADYFGVSVDYLLSGETSTNQSAVKEQLKKSIDDLTDEQAEAFLKIIKTL